MNLHSLSLEALKIIKEKTSEKDRIVFVSGNFNIVHPGHLRLLRFAAECGDFLVVGIYDLNSIGALIPEELRLEGIKSISLVDYAFILKDPPEVFISDLKPSIVVKGNEHQFGYNPEKEIVESYGGKLLFSSGDITFSSLDLLKKEFQEYNHSTIQKPREFLSRHGFTFSDLRDILKRINNLKVIVLGDLIIDEYITCDPLGMSQEDPTIVVTPIDKERFVGGSGIVAAHANSLGAEVHYLTVCGKDNTAGFAKSRLDEYGLRSYFFYDDGRPTTLKQRFRSNGKTLLRVSYLRQHDINKELASQILHKFKSQLEGTDLVIFSDFNYGALPQFLVDEIINVCLEKKINMVADSQSSSQVGDVSRFTNMSLITPTEREARLAMRDFNSGLIVLAESLRKKTNSKNIIITLGQEGLLIHANRENDKEFLTDRLPSMNSAPKDVAGAGDSFFVCSSLALASRANIWESTYLGALAAACQVGRIGNLPLTPKDIEIELNNGN